MRTFKWTSLALMVSLGVARVANAQSGADKAAAEALFDEGKRLRDAKRYSEACPKLADSQRLDPAVGTLLNLALCYKENGQTGSAWSTYREAAALAATAHQADREQLARDEASALETKLTRLVIEVSPEASQIPGLEVKRDGAVVPQGLWGIAAPVDPGVRMIDATAPGKKPLHMEARAEGAGATAKVVITALEDDQSATAAPMPAAVAPAAAPPPPGPEQQPADKGSKPGSTQRIIGYVVGGLGVVGLGVGGVFTLKSRAENESAENLCPDYPQGDCSSEDVDDHEDYVKQATASQLNSFVFFGLGGVGVITGAVLVITAPSGEKKTTRLRVIPDVSTNRLGLGVSGTF